MKDVSIQWMHRKEEKKSSNSIPDVLWVALVVLRNRCPPDIVVAVRIRQEQSIKFIDLVLSRSYGGGDLL